MALIYWGEVDAASDTTMAFTVNTVGTLTRQSIIDLITPIAAGIIAGNPTIIAAAEAAVANALTSKLALSKCVHLAGGRWAWDGPNGASATHYVLRIDGRWRTAAYPFPTPSSTRPAISWN